MVVGDPVRFALESWIEKAFENPAQLALGFFNILVQGQRYGVHQPDATLLAVSFDEVSKRLERRGTHVVPYSDAEPGVLADAFRASIYGNEYGTPYPGMTLEDFAGSVVASNINWAPDGDEAFDDGSYVLQIDRGDCVRLIAFKTEQTGRFDSATLSDLTLKSDDFYDVLRRWHAEFLSEWEALPKT
jgi:hypothetical protein